MNRNKMKTKEMIAKNKAEGQIMVYTCVICKKRFMVEDELDIPYEHMLKKHTAKEMVKWVLWPVDIVKLSSLQGKPKPPDKRYREKKK